MNDKWSSCSKTSSCGTEHQRQCIVAEQYEINHSCHIKFVVFLVDFDVFLADISVSLA